MEQEPLCSQPPLTEKIKGDLDMTAKELELVDVLKKRPRAKCLKAY